MKLISVLIVEANEITRIALQLTINQISGLRVVGSAGDGDAAIQMCAELNPSVVLINVGLPGMDGIHATRRIKAEVPGIRVVMLSSRDTDDVLFSSLSAGADGYCLKEISCTQLEMALKSVAGGAAWLDAGVSNRVLSAFSSGAIPLLSDISKIVPAESPLSQREVDVIKLVIEGYSNQQIASSLNLSIETVKTHMRHIMEKLAATDRTQAAVKAMRNGFV